MIAPPNAQTLQDARIRVELHQFAEPSQLLQSLDACTIWLRPGASPPLFCSVPSLDRFHGSRAGSVKSAV
eukprot:3172058-Pleurochrysis_carterae.AAC.1